MLYYIRLQYLAQVLTVLHYITLQYLAHIITVSHYIILQYFAQVTSHNRSLAWVVGVSRTMAPIDQFSQNKQRIANIGQQTVGNKPNLKDGDFCSLFALS